MGSSVFIVTCRSFFFLVAACGIFSCGTQTVSYSMWDLVPWPGIEPGPPVLGAQSLHWITREILPSHSWKPRSSIFSTHLSWPLPNPGRVRCLPWESPSLCALCHHRTSSQIASGKDGQNVWCASPNFRGGGAGRMAISINNHNTRHQILQPHCVPSPMLYVLQAWSEWDHAGVFNRALG